MATPIVSLAFSGRVVKGRGRGRIGSRGSPADLARGWKKHTAKMQAGALLHGARVLKKSADDLLMRARALSPERTGALVTSGRVFRSGGRINPTYSVIFGDRGPSTRYALRMHDGIYSPGPLTRQKSSDDGRAGRKYLERPYRKHRARYLSAVAAGIRSGIAGAV